MTNNTCLIKVKAIVPAIKQKESRPLQSLTSIKLVKKEPHRGDATQHPCSQVTLLVKDLFSYIETLKIFI